MKKFALIALAAAAGLANAQTLQESFSSLTLPGNTTPSVSAATGRGYANTFTTFTSAGGYQLGRIRLNGTLTRNTGTNTGDTPNDNRLNLWRPGTYTAGAAATQRVAPTTTSWGTVAPGGSLNVTSETILTTTFDPAGTWTYDFYNWFDDGGAPAPDSWWSSATLQFLDNNVPPPTVDFNFGTITGGLNNAPVAALAAGAVRWYSFTLASAQSAMDLFTFGSSFDTEIGLFSATGTLIASNDDYINTLSSRIGVGSGTGYDVDGSLAIPAFGGGNATAFLGAGTYYVALAGFNSSFASGFSVTAGTAAGDAAFCINIPAPGAVALVGMGGLLAARRRRA